MVGANAENPVLHWFFGGDAVSSNCFSQRHLTLQMAKNILLIEYEQRDRNRVRSLLGPPEFEVTEARDGEEGLAAFAPSRFDVVLLCGKLPRLSPTDVIRDIRNKWVLELPPCDLLPADHSGTNTKAHRPKSDAFEILH